MVSFIFYRVIQTILILFIVTLVSFTLIHMIPGDPVTTMLGLEATKEAIDAVRAELWLDRPVMVQYGHWLGNILQGYFGKSIMYREDVSSLIVKRLPITLYLGVLAFILTTFLGTAAGIISAVRRGTFLDSCITLFANTAIAIPVFWLGILGIYALGLKLRLLPIQGFTSPFNDFWLSIRQAVMPVICLAIVPLASIARQARSSLLEVIHQDYIRTAESKGLRRWTIIMRHALKNGLIPVITLLGVQARHVIGGAVLVETVFNVPGMGRLIVRSVFDHDFVLVQACVLVIAAVVAFANLIVDISYGYLDPRIRYE